MLNRYILRFSLSYCECVLCVFLSIHTKLQFWNMPAMVEWDNQREIEFELTTRADTALHIFCYIIYTITYYIYIYYICIYN